MLRAQEERVVEGWNREALQRLCGIDKDPIREQINVLGYSESGMSRPYSRKGGRFRHSVPYHIGGGKVDIPDRAWKSSEESSIRRGRARGGGQCESHLDQRCELGENRRCLLMAIDISEVAVDDGEFPYVGVEGEQSVQCGRPDCAFPVQVADAFQLFGDSHC